MSTEKFKEWCRRYLVVLRKYVKHGFVTRVHPTLAMGKEAKAHGLELLEVAKAHEQALMTLAPAGTSLANRRKLIEKARLFFVEIVAAMETGHGSVSSPTDRVVELARTLRRRTVESSASIRRLGQGIGRRRAAEVALRKSEKKGNRLLQESNRLQNRLRTRTREILTAQEDERKKTSHQLRDEIAQALLAIHLRLLTTKSSAIAHTQSLKKEIAVTQRLVRQSVKTIRRLTQ